MATTTTTTTTERERAAGGEEEAMRVELAQLERAYAYTSPLLEKAGDSARNSFDWVKRALGTVTGTQKVYELLQQRVEDESFVTCLEKASEATLVGAKSPGLKQMEKEVLEEHKRHESAEEGEEGTRRTGSEQAEGLSEGWEIIEKEEVIDAMASFIAAYIQAHPQASKLKPQELQKALGIAFKELRKSKVLVLWQWGSAIWRIGAMSYGAFTMYTNPWLVRTVLQAVWCCSRLAIGATATAVGLL